VADQRFLAPGSPFGRDVAPERTTAKYAVEVDKDRFLAQLQDALVQA
jgi:purine nucleosidase